MYTAPWGLVCLWEIWYCRAKAGRHGKGSTYLQSLSTCLSDNYKELDLQLIYTKVMNDVYNKKEVVVQHFARQCRLCQVHVRMKVYFNQFELWTRCICHWENLVKWHTFMLSLCVLCWGIFDLIADEGYFCKFRKKVLVKLKCHHVADPNLRMPQQTEVSLLLLETDGDFRDSDWPFVSATCSIFSNPDWPSASASCSISDSCSHSRNTCFKRRHCFTGKTM